MQKTIGFQKGNTCWKLSKRTKRPDVHLVCQYCEKGFIRPYGKRYRKFCSHRCSTLRNIGRVMPDWHKEILVKFHTGKIVSDETRKKLSENHYDVSMEKNPKWLGGKSFEKYAPDWGRTLKRAIRERDNYLCQMCGSAIQGRNPDVHHIDYDKQNSNPKNLICLCVRCHRKTDSNRDYWQRLLEEKQEMRNVQETNASLEG